MQVVGAFKVFNADCNDVEEYQLKWLKLLYCVKGLGFKSYVCHLCGISFIIILNMCWIMMSDNIIIELYKLLRNMNWFDGYA